ncbi:hypothetical protein [Halobacterium sp. KA-6]|uniref:hypothetical protein n=1 Tax=Halobacterium sp. KA-6 TaxID=2896368 RepID=UPI001E2DB822|nr:hypothetical protein [Halobacterium sp. KA-6]MCD2205018.1 hypothetical protein [Halobacterium sp. KA-6]
MPMKATGRATDFAEIDRFDDGVGWIAHPDEEMQRASHALAVDGDVWVVDPVDADGIDDRFAEFGEVRGVVVLMDRHGRDAAAIAQRHSVPIYVPSFADPGIDAGTQPVTGELPGTNFEVVRTVDWPGWDEAALYDGETLVVGDVLGTAQYFTTGDERIGVHPMLRVKPPRTLEQFEPERILVGHGEGVLEAASSALEYALDGARRRAPKAWLDAVRSMV